MVSAVRFVRSARAAAAGIAIALGASAAQAAVVGVEEFNYANGAISGQTGGFGFDWNNLTQTHDGTPSNWDNLTGAPAVSGSALITNGTAAKREYNGPTSGAGSDAAPTDERNGAFRGVGSVFYATNLTRTSSATDLGASWSGMSSYDFGSERIFFGVPSNQAAGSRFFGIVESGVGTTLSSTPVNDNQAYFLVSQLDFDANILKLWVNPTSELDFANPTVTRAYAGSNWSTAVRLASGAGTNAVWDNLRITTSFAEAIAMPEPSVLCLSLLGAAGLLRRRNRLA